MVAEVESKTRKPGERGSTVSVLSKARARNLYLNQGLSVPAVAEQCGLSESVVRKWADREGWAAERKTTYSRLVQKSDAQAATTLDAVAKAIASESEELALSGLAKAKAEITSGGEFAARNFQSWSGGVKNFVQVARLMRDPGANAGEGATNLAVNLFFVGQGAQKSDPKQSEPIEVKAVTVKSAK